MEHGINESDWKLFRQLQPLALDRFCQRVLTEVRRLTADTDTSNHERYLAMFKYAGLRSRATITGEV